MKPPTVSHPAIENELVYSVDVAKARMLLANPPPKLAGDEDALAILRAVIRVREGGGDPLARCDARWGRNLPVWYRDMQDGAVLDELDERMRQLED